MKNSTLDILLSRDFILCFVSFFLIWISFDFFILLPLFILKIGGNSIDVGIQTAIFFFPAVFMRPVAGWLTDIKGRLKVLWFGSALMMISGFAFLLLRGRYDQVKFALALILMLRGIGFAAFYTAFFTYVVDLTRIENRARILGLFGVSGLIGHGLAPRLGELILERYGFDGFFWASGLLSGASLLLSFAMREVPRIAHAIAPGLQAVRTVFWSRANVIILPAAFVFGFVVASFNTFGAPYFQQAGRVSIGYFFLVYGLTAGLVRIFLGGIADRFERWKMVTVFFAVQGAGIYLFTIQPIDTWYLPAAILSGLGHGILFPLLTAMAIDAHQEHVRGVVTSVFTATMELGFSLGSYLLGFIVAMQGFTVMFGCVAVLATLLAFYVLLGYTALRRVFLVAPADSGPISG